MKILYLVHQFYPEYYTGTEKFICNMARVMQAWGHRVRVVTSSSYPDSTYPQSAGDVRLVAFSYKGVPVVAFKHQAPPADIHVGLESEALRRVAPNLIAADMPDVVHVGHSMRVAEFARAAQAMGIPCIFTLTDFFLMCPRYTLLTSRGGLCPGPRGCSACAVNCPEMAEHATPRRVQLARELLFGAYRAVSPSAFLAEVFNREFPGLNVGVVHHGISSRTVRRNARTYAKDSLLTLFYAGSLLPHKGVHVLLEALQGLASDRIALKVYGSGPNPAFVEKLKSSAGPRVEFCGVYSQEQIGDILGAVDVAVVPSLWYENYPLVLHEALACQVPVIASNVGGMAEKIHDGVNGRLFRIGDAGHLREVLQDILADPRQLNGFKRNIAHMMIPTVEQEAYAYEREYRRILRAAAGRGAPACSPAPVGA